MTEQHMGHRVEAEYIQYCNLEQPDTRREEHFCSHDVHNEGA